VLTLPQEAGSARRSVGGQITTHACFARRHLSGFSTIGLPPSKKDDPLYFSMAVNIDLQERFPHLSRAPITEALLEVRARAQVPWNKDEISRKIIEKVPDYPATMPEHGIENRIDTTPSTAGQIAVTSNIEIQWQGLRCQSPSVPQQVVRFTRDAFLFSRLQPYENFDAFSQEGLRLLQLHREIADPGSIQRLGLRFINRIEIPPNGRLKDYFTAPPREASKLRLPLSGFYHNDSIIVPGHPYAGNVAKTMQVFPEATNLPPALILDLSVYVPGPLPFFVDFIVVHLKNMRWLKNKLFFGNLTPGALEQFK
jgi:uncharacterized protein (TIGR04255 family)